MYEFLGQDWSFYPCHNSRGQLNIVSGASAVTSRILHLLLTRKGEDPIHPSLGVAPDLFQPLSDTTVQYFIYEVKQEILAWNEIARIGIKALTVSFDSSFNLGHGISVVISFVPFEEYATSVLTFGFYEYTGALASGNIENFINTVTLNGSPFKQFR